MSAIETGWVIECGGGDALPLYYWAGLNRWSPDHLAAVRFARRVDAERVLSGIVGLPARVLEHEWHAP